jgi:hypothetical protein
MQVVLQGFRVEHDDEAIAFDRLPESARDEFRRKIRTLSGNFQLVARLPSVILPWRNPIWIQFVSHKLLRLAVPWALLLLLICGFALEGRFYRLCAYSQLAFYAIALAGVLGGSRVHSRVTSTFGSFLILNAAAWLAFWVWVAGRADRTWTAARYGRNRSQGSDAG